MKKKILIGIVVTVAIVVGAYFGIRYFTTPTLQEGIGIAESEVQFRVDFNNENVGPPQFATFTILCGKDYARNFTVTLEQANSNKLKAGYELLPEAYYSWFVITTPSYQDGPFIWNKATFDDPVEFGDMIEIPAGCYRQLQICLVIPESFDYYGKNAEVRARATEVASSGQLNILAVESRWYIIISEQSSV